MTLRLIREPSQHGATLGVLFIDGVFQCWTLEDVVREQKIPGETAIPAGRYPLKLTPSPRFNRVLPEVLTVPNFVGVRIHGGNRASDTEGCVLVGEQRGDAWVGSSQIALGKLMARLVDAASIELVIENPA
jgi:hypothetical protein